jgi:hypothetical protein
MSVLPLHRNIRGHTFLICALTACVAAVTTPVLAQDEPVGFISEPQFIANAIDFGARTIGDGSGMKSGFYPEMSNMPTGSGWISGGPGYRRWLFGDRALVDASAAYSWRGYKMAQTRVEVTNLFRSRLAVGSQARWQDLTQVTYFGEGPETPETDRSEYRLKSLNVVGYGIVRPAQWLSITGRAGWLRNPTLLSSAGTFKRGNPETSDVFANDAVFTLAEQPAYIHSDVSIAADTRDYRSHPTNGGLYRAAWANYSDRDAGMFSFNRYEAEAAHFIPVANARLVFALRGWLVGSDTASGQSVPFYLEPSLGGHNTLRSYADYRFHDRNLAVVNAESRVALFTHVDAALFVDAGNVAPRFADLDLAKRSYGVGLRVHSQRATFARFDVAHGAEGWRFLLRMNDPLHLSRLSKRMATLPFVP